MSCPKSGTGIHAWVTHDKSGNPRSNWLCRDCGKRRRTKSRKGHKARREPRS